MFQSDFHRKKNFADAKFFNTLANQTQAATNGEPTTSGAEPAAEGAEAIDNTKDIDKDNKEDGNNENNDENDKDNEKDPEDVLEDQFVKHPLQNIWTLWYLENDRTKTWEEMLNEITSFDAVEDFWSIYNHIKPPSEIKIGCDYSLFKKGIRPMWEDDANKEGGRWVITLNKSARDDLDNLWLDVLLCLIGEACENSDQICGAVVNIRAKSNKISIWTADGSDEGAALEIGHKLKDALRLGRQTLQYQLHKDAMVKLGSNIKSVYDL